MRWSVGIEADGGKVLTREEAVQKATAEFTRAVTAAGLPEGDIVRVEAISEDEDIPG